MRGIVLPLILLVTSPALGQVTGDLPPSVLLAQVGGDDPLTAPTALIAVLLLVAIIGKAMSTFRRTAPR